MAVDYGTKSFPELCQLERNFRDRGLIDDPRYKEILDCIGRQKKSGLSFKKTTQLVTQAARGRRFLSYGEIAAESDLPTNMARITVPKHLFELNEYAKHRGWPMLSAIVVTQEHVKDDWMDDSTLAGFCKCARPLGEVVGDERGYLKAQQDAVFAAAERGSLP